MTDHFPEEISLEISSITLAAKAWGPRDGMPVLAFHGWLDNAASFDHLAPFFPDWRLVSLDMPGHGFSSHRPPGTSYHFVDMLFEVVEVLDQLGWKECALLGHSMGAGIATCVAGMLGNRVRQLILIEGLGPLSQPAEKVTELMLDSLQQWNSLPAKKPPVYQTREQAVRAREFAGSMKKSSVETLVTRGLGQIQEGLVWRSDPRLRIKSRLYLSEPQVLQMIQDISAEVLVIEAKDTDTRRWVDLLRSRLEFVKNLDHQILPGRHHLHLDEPETVAEAIKAFLEKNPKG